MKRMANVMLPAIVIGVLGCSWAFAEEVLPDRGPIPFQLYDKDGDNLISEDEFYWVRAKRMQQRAEQGYPMRGAANAPDFSAFDGNGDGMLTPDELTEGQQKLMQQRQGQRGKGPMTP